MAILASNLVPAQAYPIFKGAALQLKLNLVGIVSYLSTSSADYNYLHQVSMTLKRAKKQLREMKNVPGIAVFALEQEKEVDPLYDLVAEFQTVRYLINISLQWMKDNVSTTITAKDPDLWDESGVISDVYTPVQTEGLRIAINAVIAEIS